MEKVRNVLAIRTGICYNENGKFSVRNDNKYREKEQRTVCFGDIKERNDEMSELPHESAEKLHVLSQVRIVCQGGPCKRTTSKKCDPDGRSCAQYFRVFSDFPVYFPAKACFSAEYRSDFIAG